MNADRRYASRKFWISAATLLAVWTGAVTGLATAADAIDMTKFVLAAYLLANVGDQAVTKSPPS